MSNTRRVPALSRDLSTKQEAPDQVRGAGRQAHEY